MSSTLSILGLYNYNKDLFKDMYVPEGVDKDVLINNLLQESSELEVLYSEPSFMQFMIGEWSKKMKPTFDKMLEISTAEYNPLYNVDAWETLTDHKGRNYLLKTYPYLRYRQVTFVSDKHK